MKEKLFKMAVTYIASYIRRSQLCVQDKNAILARLSNLLMVFETLEREAEQEIVYDLDELSEVA